MNESSNACQSSLNGSFSIGKWGFLLWKMRRPSVPMRKGSIEAAFCSQIPQGLSPHKLPMSSIFCIGFANLPLVAGCGLLGPFQLLVYESPQALQMSVQVAMLLMKVFRLTKFLIESLLSPTMPISIVPSTCPTKVVLWGSVSPRMSQCEEEPF